MKIEFNDQGNIYQAEAQIIRGQLWVHFQGKTFLYESESQRKRQKKSSGHGDGSVLAPMPGKITKILKTLHAEVQSGDPILVMEAMKMEYTLKANSSGRLVSLDCKVGDQVTLGKVLAKVEVEKKL